MTLDDYESLSRKLESERRQLDRIAGAIEQVCDRLEREFGVGSVEEAESLLKRMRKEAEQVERKLEEERREWEATWGERLRATA